MYQLEKNNFMSGNFLAVQCLELIFSLPWSPVESLVGELGSYKPYSMEKRKTTPYQNGKINGDFQNMSVSGCNIHYHLVGISVLVVKEEVSLLSECLSIRLKKQPSQMSIQAYVKRQLLSGKFLEMVLRIKDRV